MRRDRRIEVRRGIGLVEGMVCIGSWRSRLEEGLHRSGLVWMGVRGVGAWVYGCYPLVLDPLFRYEPSRKEYSRSI